MSNLRNIGYKIFLLADSAENGKENLCNMLNFSENDYNKLRLLTSIFYVDIRKEYEIQ